MEVEGRRMIDTKKLAGEYKTLLAADAIPISSKQLFAVLSIDADAAYSLSFEVISMIFQGGKHNVKRFTQLSTALRYFDRIKVGA